MATRQTIIQVQLQNQDAIQQLGRWEKDLQLVRKETNELNRDIRKNNGATADQERRLGELRSTAKALSGNIRELSNETSGLTAAGLRFRDKMAGAATDALRGLGIQALTVTGAVAGLSRIIGNAVDIAADFEKAQSNLAAIMGTTKEGVRELTEEAKQYGATTAFTASQVTELQTELGKLGFTQKQIQASTKSILDLAAATGTDLANAATIAAQTLNAFQLGAEETGRIVDVIAQSANLSAFDIDTFSAAMSNAAPAAKSVGVEIEEAAAMLSALVDAGIPAEKAGTDLRNIFISLADEGKTMDEAFAEVRGSTNQLTTAVEMFDQRAAGSAIILAENSEKLERLEESYRGAAGAAEEMAKTQLDNLRGDQLLLQSAWEGFVLSVEDGSGGISKALRGITQSFTDILGYITLINSTQDPFAVDGDGKGSVVRAEQATKAYRDELVRVIEAKAEERGWNDKTIASYRALNDVTEEQINNMRQRTAVQLAGLKTIEDINRAEEFATKGLEKNNAMTLKGAELQLFLEQVQKKKAEMLQASVDAENAKTRALDEGTDAVDKQAAAVRVLTDELRAFAKAQNEINQGIGIGRMESTGVGAFEASGGAAAEGAMPRPGAAIVTDLEQNVQQAELLTAQYANMFMNMSSSIGESLASMFTGVEDANQKVLLSVIELVRNSVRMYIAMAMAREVGTKGFIGLGTGIALSVAIEAILAAAVNSIQGFADGGIVRQTDGPRYTKNPGDTVLISARPNETVVTPEQRRKMLMMAGFDIFGAAGVPGYRAGKSGYAVGGMVGPTSVQGMTPRPTTSMLGMAEQTAALNNFDIQPVVSVEDIVRVQNSRVRVIERSTL